MWHLGPNSIARTIWWYIKIVCRFLAKENFPISLQIRNYAPWHQTPIYNSYMAYLDDRTVNIRTQ